jgi:hypothetical protein
MCVCEYFDLNIFLLMNYILHFFFTIQYNIGFRNKRNGYINPFPTSALRLDQAKHVSNTNSLSINDLFQQFEDYVMGIALSTDFQQK